MSNPNTFINSYASNIQQYINLTQTLRTQNDQLVQDPTIIADYFEQEATNPPGSTLNPRTDIVAADVEAAQAAIVQLLFSFDSGNPPNKAALYKMLP